MSLKYTNNYISTKEKAWYPKPVRADTPLSKYNCANPTDLAAPHQIKTTSRFSTDLTATHPGLWQRHKAHTN